MQINPLGGVPVILVGGGNATVDSAAILDHIDRMAPVDQMPWPQDWCAGRILLALITGLTDRIVSLYHEQNPHDAVSPVMRDRRCAQVRATPATMNDATMHVAIGS